MLYSIGRVIVGFLYWLLFRMEARGVSNIPAEGPVIICSNHKSMLDPFTLALKVPREMHFMAKAELFRVPIVAPLIRALGAFPVKRGAISKETIRTAVDLLRQGKVMGIFPEGTRNATLGPAKRGAVTIAIRSGATVVPAALIGNYKPFRKMIAVYGKPVDLAPYAEEGTAEAQEKATELIMSKIRYMLETGQPSE